MIVPVLSGDAFLEDIVEAERDAEALHIWWLGQSGFLVSHDGMRALLDPYLSDSLASAHAGTDRSRQRMTEPVIAPAALPPIDVVTSSHAHADHLDPDTLRPIFDVEDPPALVTPEANRALAAECAGVGEDVPIGIDGGFTLDVRGLRVTAVPAAHETVERDEHGRFRFLGYVVAIGPWRLYHSGDTVRYPGMDDLLLPHAVDVAMLPINGRDPARGMAGNMTGEEAAQLAYDIAAGVAIPCHYDMFALDTAAPEPFLAAAARLGQPAARLRAGERLTLAGSG